MSLLTDHSHPVSSEQAAEIWQRLEIIEGRNRRVEAEKQWEGSWVRRSLIMVFTYVVVLAYNYAIGGAVPFLTALVPVAGFTLSTVTFKRIKKRRVSRQLAR